MPERPPVARFDPLTDLKQPTQFQLLWHQVSIDTSLASPEVDHALTYLTNDASHDFAPVGTMSYTVRLREPSERNSLPGNYSILEEGDLLANVANADDVLDVVYRRVYQRSFELASLRGWVRLHAATVELPTGRALISAPSGIGKTTLSCALRLAGLDVPADESVLVRGGESIPVPRRFHIKIPAPAALPELRDIVERAPRLTSQAVAAVDPRELGGAWTVTKRPVEALFLLERSSETRVDVLSAVETIPALIEGCFRNQEGTADVFRAATSVARATTCHRLFVDDPRHVAAMLRG